MNDLSVGECLRESDQRVREITFDLGDVEAERLLVAWPAFLAASARVLTGLGWPDTTTAAAIMGEARRWTWPPPQIDGDARMAAAADLLNRAGEMIEREASPAAPDRGQVSNHVIATLCVGAHVVGRSVREHLAATQDVAEQRSVAQPAIIEPRAIHRATYTLLVDRIDRIEDLATIALQGAGRLADPAPDPQGEARVEDNLTAWVNTAEKVLQGAPSVTDLRNVAKVHGHLAMHTTVLVVAADQIGGLSPDQVALILPGLQSAHTAWSAATGDWPTHMTSPARPPSRELAHAAANLTQTLAAITHPGARWLTGPEIAADHDVGVLVDYLADGHRRVSHIAHDYEAAATALLAGGQVTVSATAAVEYIGRAARATRVAVPAAHASRMSFSGGRLALAAESARIGLDTGTVTTERAIRARARLPLSLSGADIEAAIRHRVEEATRSRSGRLDQLAGQVERSISAASARPDDRRGHQQRRDGRFLS